MKLMHNEAALMPYQSQYPLIHIERCGRTCYNSLDKMRAGTDAPFIQSLINSKHYAMLEHANFVFEVTHHLYNRLLLMNKVSFNEQEEPVAWGAKHLSFTYYHYDNTSRFLVSGNVRAINNTRCAELTECLRKHFPILVYREPVFQTMTSEPAQWVPDIFKLPNLQAEEVRAHCYLTFKCDTDRGVTHEMVRHREASYAQESTRYCNYSKEKYGGELTFIVPSTFDSWNARAQGMYRSELQSIEIVYNLLTQSHKLTAQQARAILPNSLKSTILMTANVDEFLHFFKLRYLGVTGAPHPDMKDLAGKMLEEYRRFLTMKEIRHFSTIVL